MLRQIKRTIAKKANYKRTSSGGQDLDLQDGANAEFLKDYKDEDIIPFTDFDVSANKIPMKDRPALNRMLKLIEQGLIDTVIAYGRDRIARNVYEYVYIAQIFYKYDVEVIYTATDEPPFSNDLFLETWYGLSAQFEGQRISTRLSDARKRNPPSLIGYKKQIIKNDNGTQQRIYKADPKVKQELYNLFKDFSEVVSRENIFDVIMKYESSIKRNEFRIMEILKTPFFAGYFVSLDGSYQQMSHVEPIISLDLFKKVQMKLDEFEDGINRGISISQLEGKFNPICGKCHTQMKFKKGKIGDSGLYHCPKHRKISIGVHELNEYVIESIQTSAKKISVDKMEKVTIKSIKNNIWKLKKASDETQMQLENLCIKISQQYKPSDQSLSIQKLFKRMDDLRETITLTEKTITSLNVLTQEINLLTEILKGISEKRLTHLENNEVFELAELLISSISIYEDHVLFNFYFNDFFLDGDDTQDVS